MKRIISFCMVILITVVLLELSTFIFWGLKEKGVSYESIYKDAQRDVRGVLWSKKKNHHPFFGYTFDCSEEEGGGVCNNIGFHTLQNLPYKRKHKDEIVVALFGGSYAEMFYLDLLYSKVEPNLESFKRELSEALGLEGKEITVLNFGVGGYHHPQQRQIASFFMDSFDIAIAIDGYNEMMQGPIMGHPEEYYFKSLNNLKSIRYIFLNIASRFVHSFFRSIDKFVQMAPVIKKSSLAHSIWRLSEGVLVRSHYYFNSIATAARDKASEKWNEFKNPKDKNFRAEEWVRESIKFVKLLQVFEKPSWSFVQPNQYLEHSKIFTEDEKKYALVNDLEERSKRVGYMNQLNLEYKKRLKGRYPVYSLAQIFKETTETIYFDNCCHVNFEGVKITLGSIIKVIKENPQNRVSGQER